MCTYTKGSFGFNVVNMRMIWPKWRVICAFIYSRKCLKWCKQMAMSKVRSQSRKTPCILMAAKQQQKKRERKHIQEREIYMPK